MGLTYPPAGAVIEGDIVKTHALLKDPAAVQMRVAELSKYAFVSDILFPTPVEASGGAVSYANALPSVTDRDPEGIAPGGEYPLALAQGGVPMLAKVTKYGEGVPITDEEIKRTKIAAAEVGMTQAINRTVNYIDSLALTAASAAITQTYTSATGSWGAPTADPFADILLAAAQAANDNSNEGYNYDLLILDLVRYAKLITSKTVVDLQKNDPSFAATGQLFEFAGIRFAGVPAARMPAGVPALLADSTRFGEFGYEDLGSPEFSGDAKEIQTSIVRDPRLNDSYLLRVRRSYVPVIKAPRAAIKLMGV